MCRAQRFHQTIQWRTHCLCRIVDNSDFDSKHGLNVVVLGIATSTHCEEDSCLTSVESGKKALVFKMSRTNVYGSSLSHHQIVIAYIP